MPFETPITIREAMKRIQHREYLLPGIQREFVWTTDQICRLFDSLLRGYPIGSFLFWQVAEEQKTQYSFYEFLREYHEQESTHNVKASLLPTGGLTAVLDGQQRLTSLYIGLLGSYTERRKYARRAPSSSYTKRRLYLNLARPSEHTELHYEFRFLEAEADFFKKDADLWFRVGHILSFKHTTDVFRLVLEHQLTESKHPTDCLVELHKTVTELPLVNFFTEVEQDLDRVLNIFIRVNSGGTPLSYSDLLLSIASAQWEERDAREAVHELVDEINTEFGDFDFPRDFVLKCCLMLADVDLRWKVSNFNQANMRKIEVLWPKIEDAIRLAVQTVATFGFTGKSLASTNAVIPIVYYLFQRGCPSGFAEAAIHRTDRDSIQRWLNIVLLKRTFGGVPDNVLRPMRDIIRANHTSFPSEDIAAALETTPYALSFRPGELEGLLDQQYGGPYTFPLLAMLYPSLDYRNKFHLDHIHPKSHFTPSQLTRRGIPPELHARYADRVNRVANLQLMEGQPNIEKGDTPFAEWLETRYAGEKEKREAYLQRNYIVDDNLGLDAFLDFYAQRRHRLLARLQELLGLAVVADTDDALELAADRETASFNSEVAGMVGRHLGVSLSANSQTCYADTNDDVRVVCVVSKRYQRAGQDRYWYAIKPHQVDYLASHASGYVAFGCGSSELIAMIPSDHFLPSLSGMLQTEVDTGRTYWHVELFGDASHLELSQPLLETRLDVTSFALTPAHRSAMR